MLNGVLLVAIMTTWILKVTSLPKLYYQNCHVFCKIFVVGIKSEEREPQPTNLQETERKQ